jgi:predicted site-specific integrase-resolvase
MPQNTSPDLIGSAEVCERAGIDRSTLSRHVALGKIAPAMRLPGQTGALLFDRKAVAVYIATIKPERVA